MTKSVRLLWNDPGAFEGFRTGVSLHSHTRHSKEILSFIPRVAPSIPFTRTALNKVEEMHEARRGERLDYSRGWWNPPLSAQAAQNLEAGQIGNKLGLEPLVSLSDHDNIEAASLLRLVDGYEEVPISAEWTVTYSLAKFHIGVHNLPRNDARPLMAAMREHTADPESRDLREILAELHAIDNVLIILNHPVCDQGHIGREMHEDHVRDFLQNCGEWIHALELNGMQPWKDNCRVALMARQFGKPIVSGGDRHGCEPNANVNVTNAATFDEFVSEIRDDGESTIVFLPHYREPLKIRYLEGFWHILRDMPDNPGREHWSDRVFYQLLDGEPQPISELARSRGLDMFSRVISVMGFLASKPVRPALKLVWSEQEGGSQ